MISNILARLLGPAEREAVLGDLAERGASTLETVRELLGLIARRQSAMWGHWRPWTALVLLIVPLSFALSLQSRYTSGNTSIYLWLYFNNWDWRLVGMTAFQNQFPRYIAEVFLRYLTLICYAWIGGFVIGGTARRALPSLGTLLAIALGLAEFAALPWLQSYVVHVRSGRDGSPNGPVYEVWFYRELMPYLVQFALVFVPALWGMRSGAKIRDFQPWVRAILWSAAILAIPSLLVPNFLGMWRNPWLQLLQPAVYWPIAYWIGRIAHQRFVVRSSGKMIP